MWSLRATRSSLTWFPAHLRAQALSDVVAAIIQNDEAATSATVNARLPPTVAVPDKAHFTQLVLQEFAALHSGNAVRFGIRPLEFAAWKERHGGT